LCDLNIRIFSVLYEVKASHDGTKRDVKFRVDVSKRNRLLWELREKKEGTDIEITCVDGAIAGHQLVLLPICTKIDGVLRRKKSCHFVNVHASELSVKAVESVLELCYLGEKEVDPGFEEEFEKAKEFLGVL